MKHLILCTLFAIGLCTSLYCTRPYEYRQSKGHQQFGHRVIKQGVLYERPMVSVEYGKREWGLYCPAIHKRPKNYGQYLK